MYKTYADESASNSNCRTGSYAVDQVGQPWYASRATVAIWANADRRYVTADNGGASPLLADRGAVGGWEKFRFESLGGNLVAIRSMANGMYVTAENEGASPLIANRTAVGPWETFTYIITPQNLRRPRRNVLQATDITKESVPQFQEAERGIVS